MDFVKVTDIFCKDGCVHIRPAHGTYEKIYRAAKGVYWDESTSTLFFKGKVLQEEAIKFISEAMENEYYTILVFD